MTKRKCESCQRGVSASKMVGLNGRSLCLDCFDKGLRELRGKPEAEAERFEDVSLEVSGLRQQIAALEHHLDYLIVVAGTFLGCQCEGCAARLRKALRVAKERE